MFWSRPAERSTLIFPGNTSTEGCDRFRKTGRMMLADGLDQLRLLDAIYLGAVGSSGVPDHVSLWGLSVACSYRSVPAITASAM